MKKRILETIYNEFENWASTQKFSCQAGCSTCCTQNVTITALEGERILEYCMNENLRSWLFGQLEGVKSPGNPQQTTNEYALAALHGNEESYLQNTPTGKCPFLEDNMCKIYPVRPFSCRCFASESVCCTNKPATVADRYLYSSMVTMQIIEHLGQFDQWGYMTDVLSCLIDVKNYAGFSGKAACAKKDLSNNLRVAQPLPGFLIPPEYQQQINPLLRAIFDARIEEKTVEQILNGN